MRMSAAWGLDDNVDNNIDSNTFGAVSTLLNDAKVVLKLWALRTWCMHACRTLWVVGLDGWGRHTETLGSG